MDGRGHQARGACPRRPLARRRRSAPSAASPKAPLYSSPNWAEAHSSWRPEQAAASEPREEGAVPTLRRLPAHFLALQWGGYVTRAGGDASSITRPGHGVAVIKKKEHLLLFLLGGSRGEHTRQQQGRAHLQEQKAASGPWRLSRRGGRRCPTPVRSSLRGPVRMSPWDGISATSHSQPLPLTLGASRTALARVGRRNEAKRKTHIAGEKGFRRPRRRWGTRTPLAGVV